MMNKLSEKELSIHQGGSPAEMISQAISGGADLDKLERLLSLQERWEANEAKKAYHKAMSEFKASPPKIFKDRKVGYVSKKDSSRVGYSHATLGNVTEKVNESLSKYGLSASWSTQQNGKIEVTCKITHVQGHSEQTTLIADADRTGSKNSIQAIGSTITYLERYTLLALTGLATFDQDDDGQLAGGEKIDDQQMHNIRDQLIELNASEEKFLAYLGLDKLEEMPKDDYPKAQAALGAKRKSKKEKREKKGQVER